MANCILLIQGPIQSFIIDRQEIILENTLLTEIDDVIKINEKEVSYRYGLTDGGSEHQLVTTTHAYGNWAAFGKDSNGNKSIGDGNDVLLGGSGVEQDELFEDFYGDDVFYGFEGDDTFHIYSGNDVVHAGDGDDIIKENPMVAMPSSVVGDDRLPSGCRV